MKRWFQSSLPKPSSPKPSSSKPLTYLIEYNGNNSKRWDGKKIIVDGEWLRSLYSTEELVIGKELKLPWKAKGGKVVEWKAVLCPDAERKAPAELKAPKKKENTCSHKRKGKRPSSGEDYNKQQKLLFLQKFVDFFMCYVETRDIVAIATCATFLCNYN